MLKFMVEAKVFVTSKNYNYAPITQKTKPSNMFFQKIKFFSGKLLAKTVIKFPRQTKALRRLGIPVNAYMPWLNRSVARLVFSSELEIGASQKFEIGLAKHREKQNGLSQVFEGNVRPIRISRIRKTKPRITDKTRIFSSIIPGDAYSFSDEAEYLHQYENSYFAFSPKKGGWDTMRTIEIFFSDCLPIIPNLESQNELSLWGYPKDFLSSVWKSMQNGKNLALPDKSDLAWLANWREQYLTCESQAMFILNQANFAIEGREKVLYLDLGMMETPNYVSMANFVGLYRCLGSSRFITINIPDFLVEPATSDSINLYGRGFGYAGELSESGLKSTKRMTLTETVRQSIEILEADKKILLIVGGAEYLDHVPELRHDLIMQLRSKAFTTVIIHGGDIPLTASEEARLSDKGLLFIREPRN